MEFFRQLLLKFSNSNETSLNSSCEIQEDEEISEKNKSRLLQDNAETPNLIAEKKASDSKKTSSSKVNGNSKKVKQSRETQSSSQNIQRKRKLPFEDLTAAPTTLSYVDFKKIQVEVTKRFQNTIINFELPEEYKKMKVSEKTLQYQNQCKLTC